MPESNVIVFPGKDFDPSNPLHVEAWLGSILPVEQPNRRDIASFAIRTRGGMKVSFRVTRTALEKLDGSADDSTAMIAQRHFDAIEDQCRALYERSPAQPIKGWTLDAADLI